MRIPEIIWAGRAAGTFTADELEEDWEIDQQLQADAQDELLRRQEGAVEDSENSEADFVYPVRLW